MFERNKIDRPEQGTLSAQLTLDDGRTVAGKIVIPISRSVFDLLNQQGGFLEFEPFGGEREFIAKHTLRSLKLMEVPRTESLNAKLRSLDQFEPHTVLGVASDAPWDDVRQAFLSLSKLYHPDRYAGVELPPEIQGYLASMARRINAAYGALEVQRTFNERRPRGPSQPIYQSTPRY
ncbi:MAG: J domain-containing protein [Pseudomonadota bacterium]